MLVQNSAATTSLSITDDGVISISGRINGRNSSTALSFGGIFTRTATIGTIGSNLWSIGNSVGLDTVQYPTINWDGNQNVGIGTTTISARTHIQGSGSTSATTALLVQNSAGTTWLQVRDDGVVLVPYQVNANLIRASGNLAVSSFQTQNYAGNWMSVDDLGTIGNVTIGNGATTLSARLGVKGSGSTSATTAFLVQNSAGTTKFSVDDSAVGAEVKIGNLINGYSSLQWPANNVGIGLISGGGLAAKVTNNSSFVISDSGTATNTTSAKLVVDSTNAGFLPPRMTTTQRTAITTPAEGLIVMDITLHKLYVHNGTAWEQIQSI